MKKITLALMINAVLANAAFATDSINSSIDYSFNQGLTEFVNSAENNFRVAIKFDQSYSFEYGDDNFILQDILDKTGVLLKYEMDSVNNIYIFQVSSPNNIEQTISLLKNNSYVSNAAQDLILKNQAETTITYNYDYMNSDIESRGLSTQEFSDTYIAQQLYMEDPSVVRGASNIKKAKELLSKQNKKMRIGIIDSGVLPFEDVFVAEGYKIATTLDVNRGSNFSATTTYSVDETIEQKDPNTGDITEVIVPTDYSCASGHGTAISHVIGATSNNNSGITGIIDADLVMVKAFETNCKTKETVGSLVDISDSIYWASGREVQNTSPISQPVDIIALSVGSTEEKAGCPFYLQEAINYANSKGIITVVSSGNEGVDAINRVPANCTGVIQVTSNDKNADKSDFANYGNIIKVSAIGEGIIAAHSNSEDGGGYSIYKDDPSDPNNSWNSTDFSSAIVAGVAGLVKEKYPSTNYEVFKKIIAKTSRPHNVQEAPKDFNTDCSTGRCGGVLEAYATLEMADNKLGYPFTNESRFKGMNSCEENLELEAINHYLDVCSIYTINVTSSEPNTSYFEVFKTTNSDFLQSDDNELISTIKDGKQTTTLFDVKTDEFKYGIRLCESDKFCYPIRELIIDNSSLPEFCKK